MVRRTVQRYALPIAIAAAISLIGLLSLLCLWTLHLEELISSQVQGTLAVIFASVYGVGAAAEHLLERYQLADLRADGDADGRLKA